MRTILYLLFAIGLTFCSATSSAQTVSGKVGGHKYVDLGLPSGLKWATCNIGASKPTDYGNYFAWGEVKPKKKYDWITYKWSKYIKVSDKGHKKKQIKYCANSIVTYEGKTFMPQGGVPDTLSTLEKEDDAATVNWGKKWRMPTTNEQQELLDGCTWEWTTNFSNTGITGLVGTSKTNGNVIFLPASGFRMNSVIRERDKFGAYWSSSLSMTQDQKNMMDPSAYSLGLYFFFKKEGLTNWDDRFFGMNVRAVVK